MKEMPGAAFVAAAFCLMQNSPVDKAMYYDAQPSQCYGGLYYFPSLKLTKTYYSFMAFNDLFRLGTAVECQCNGFDDVYVCAAKKNDKKGAVLIINRKLEKREVPMTTTGIDGVPKCFLLDSSHLLTETNHMMADGRVILPPQSVLLMRIG
jgi:hypothetical protein